MAQIRTLLLNNNDEWDPNRRYKVNSVATKSGATYQNFTGFNSDPAVGTDWVKTSSNGSGAPYKASVSYSGSDIELDPGITISLVLLNDVPNINFTQTGINLALADAQDGDVVGLIGTQN